MFSKGCLTLAIVGAATTGEARSVRAAKKTNAKEMRDDEIRQG